MAKNTKHALLMSVLSMMLCMAMLVSSTFAWFTDSVTSGTNRIVAGNLDVELYYNNASTKDEWKDASKEKTETPNFFVDKDGNNILWEPGVMAYTYFKVTNEGSLALKYELTTIVEGCNNLNGRNLSEVIKFVVIEGAADLSQGRDSKALAGRTYANFDAFKPTGKLAPKPEDGESSDIFTVVAYWKPDVEDDDQFNVNNGATVNDYVEDKANNYLWLDIGVRLDATQDTVEPDSFGPDYDKDAEYPDPSAWDGKTSNTDWYDEEETSFTISTPEDLAGLAKLVNTGTNFKNKTITLESDINLAGKEWAPIGSGVSTAFDGTFDGNKHTISNVEVNSDSNYAGFFGVLGPDARVENLTLNNVSVVSLGNGVGAVAGYGNINWSPVAIPTIENVQLTGTLTVEGNWWVGGIVGYQHANVIGCTIDAEAGSTVTGAEYVGGLLGQSEGISGITKYISKNTLKNVTIVGTKYVGGIMGVAQVNGEITDNTLENVTVNAAENASGIGALVGRVYLYIGGNWPLKMTLKLNGNSGTVAVNNAAQSDVCDGLVGVTESDRPENATFIFDGVNDVTATWNE